MISKLLYLISINYFFVIENTFVLTCDLPGSLNRNNRKIGDAISCYQPIDRPKMLVIAKQSQIIL